MPLFETKKSNIVQDFSVLDTQSDPPEGLLLCRDTLMTFMASNVSSIFTTGRARNMFIWGRPGTGKTASVQYLLNEVQKHSIKTNSPVATAYVNTGRTRNPYYTLLEILKQLNISVPEVGWQFFRLKQAFENTLKEKSVLIAIDEVENILFKEKEPLIYYLNRQPKTTLILISNKLSQATQLPERCLSTLQPEMLLFNPYSENEAFQILKARVQKAFKPNVISDELLWTIANATEEMSDIRFGISMLLTAGQSAEQNQRASINNKDVDFAIENTRKVKSLTAINELGKRIKKQTGRTINF
jgi:cell division control protein 6